VDQEPAGVLPHLVPVRGPAETYPGGNAGQLVLAFFDQLLMDVGVHDGITFRSKGDRGVGCGGQLVGGSPLGGSLPGSAPGTAIG
jgi:hypothetical protein